MLPRAFPEAGGDKNLGGDSGPQKQAGANPCIPIPQDQFSLALATDSTSLGPPVCTKTYSSTSGS